MVAQAADAADSSFSISNMNLIVGGDFPKLRENAKLGIPI